MSLCGLGTARAAFAGVSWAFLGLDRFGRAWNCSHTNVDSGRHRSLPCLYWVLGREGLGGRVGSEESPFLIHSLPGIHSAVHALAATLDANAGVCSSHTWLSVFMVMSVCFLTHILPVSSPIRSVSSPLSFSFLSLSLPPLFFPYLYLVLSCPILSVIPSLFLWLAQICISCRIFNLLSLLDFRQEYLSV